MNDTKVDAGNESSSALKQVLQNAPVRTKPAPRDENLHQDIVIFGPDLIACHANGEEARHTFEDSGPNNRRSSIYK